MPQGYPETILFNVLRENRYLIRMKSISYLLLAQKTYPENKDVRRIMTDLSCRGFYGE